MKASNCRCHAAPRGGVAELSQALAEAVEAKPYTLDGRYEEGEKVDHRSFGLGMVKKWLFLFLFFLFFLTEPVAWVFSPSSC